MRESNLRKVWHASRRCRILLIALFLCVIVSTTMFVLAGTLSYIPFFGIGMIIAMGIIPMSCVFARFYKRDKNGAIWTYNFVSHKRRGTKHRKTSETVTAEPVVDDSEKSNRTPTPYFEPKKDGTYGWSQTGAPADYSLLHRFEEHISEHFKRLPLEKYSLPKDLFLELDEELRIQHKPSDECLKKIILDMERHLGHKENVIQVSVRLVSPGERIAGTHIFEFSYSYIHVWFNGVYDVYNVLEILAHEISHAYQRHNGCPYFSDDELEMEQFTDALAIYLGFGEIYKFGQKYLDSGNVVRLGYLSDNNLISFYETWEEQLVKKRYRKEAEQHQEELLSVFDKCFANFDHQYQTMLSLISSWKDLNPGDSTLLVIESNYVESGYYEQMKSLRLKVAHLTMDEVKGICQVIDTETGKLLQTNIQIEKLIRK